CLLGGLEEEVFRPAFGKAAYRARADEGGGFDAQARFLRNLSDRADVVFVSAGSAIGANPKLVVHDLARQSCDMLDRARAGTGQAEIERVDAQRLHQVENRDLVLDNGIAHGGRLQAVAQSLIVEQHLSGGPQRLRVDGVPVVDEGGFHASVSVSVASLQSPVSSRLSPASHALWTFVVGPLSSS